MHKVLFNGLLISGKFSGVRRSIEALVNAFAAIDRPDIHIEVMLGKDFHQRLNKANSISLVPQKVPSANRLRRIFFENVELPQAFKAGGFDVYHSPGYILPMWPMDTGIVTIHDIIALQFPALCRPENRWYFNALLPRTIRRASRIIAVSNHVKTDILNLFPNIDPDKIVVVHQGVGQHFKAMPSPTMLNNVKNKYRLPETFLLFVGNIEPKKNLLRVVDAFKALKTCLQIPHRLVMAGTKSWGFSQVVEHVRRQQLIDDVLFPGFIEDADLPAVYQLADVFLFPSLYEGFGIPPLEAMSMGTPVVASTAGALPETTGGRCFLVNPYDNDEMIRTLVAMLNDPALKRKHCAAAIEWSRQFSWEETARKTMDQYLYLIESRKRKKKRTPLFAAHANFRGNEQFT